MTVNNNLILVDNEGVTFSNDVIPSTDWQSLNVPYTLWFEPSRLSVNLKYVMPVRVLVDTEESQIIDGEKYPLNFTVQMDMDSSEVFTFVPRQVIVGSVEESFNEVFNITWGEHWYLYQVQNGTSISNETIIVNDKIDNVSFFITQMTTIYDPLDLNQSPWVFKVDETHLLFTFYIMCCNTFEETVLKNIRVKVFNDNNPSNIVTDSVIRIGATFYDKSEELVVNARNQGIVLPYDICKAFWDCGFNEYHADRVVERDKLKELLFNYMGIRGECGNYNSAIKSLEWFGWGNKLELSQLIVLNQNVSKYYLNDYFDLFSDIPQSFKNFRRTTYLSIKANINKPHHLGRPVLNSSEGTTTVPSTETLYRNSAEDGIRWKTNRDIFKNNPKYTGTVSNTGKDDWQKRYHYIMHEFALKLSCLAYLYETYLLPVQLNIHSSTVVEHVSTTPMKLLSGSYRHCTVAVDNITLSEDPYITWGQTSYTVQLDTLNKLDSFLEIEFFVNVPENHSKYISLVFYLCSGSEMKYSKFDGVRASESQVRYTAKIPLQNIYDPTTINMLSVLVEGHWFETNITVRYPAYTLQAGTLKYDYDLTKVESNILLGNNEEYDPNLMLSRKYDDLKKEEQVWKDYFSSESMELVSELQQYNLVVPRSRKNLVFTQGLENVFYEWVGPNEIELDNINVSSSEEQVWNPGLFHGIIYTQDVQEQLNMYYKEHVFEINNKTCALRYYLKSNGTENLEVIIPVPKSVAYMRIFCLGSYKITGIEETTEKNVKTCFESDITDIEINMLKLDTANKIRFELTDTTELYGIEFISADTALQINDFSEVKTSLNDTNLNEIICLPRPRYLRVVKLFFEEKVENLVQIEFGKQEMLSEPVLDKSSFDLKQYLCYTYNISNDGLPLVFDIPKDINYLKIITDQKVPCKIKVGTYNTLEPYPRKLDSSEFKFSLQGKDVSQYFDAYIVENVYHYLGTKLLALIEYLQPLEPYSRVECSELISVLYNCRYLVKFSEGVINPDTSKKYSLVDMAKDIRYYVQQLQIQCFEPNLDSSGTYTVEIQEIIPGSMLKLWKTLTFNELAALERSGNFYYTGNYSPKKLQQATQYYLQIISKEPMCSLFDNPELYTALGITSLKEEFLKKWARNNLEYKFEYYTNNLFEFKSVKITPQLQFLVTRHNFVPQQENDTRFVSNSFFKDDIVAVRIANKYTDAPFIYHLKENDPEYKFEFRPSFINSKDVVTHQSKGFTNYVIMDRVDTDSAYLKPGYYDVIFKFNYNLYDNESKVFKNFIKIKPEINSKIYYDIYPTIL